MSTFALILALLALFAVVIAWGRLAVQGARLDELEGELRRLRNNAGGGSDEFERLRTQVMRLAEGEPLTAEMVDEGRLWHEVGAREAEALVGEADVLTIDVRTPMEWAAGTIPGALKLPVQELEERWSEIPDDGRRKLVVCAAGVRSAAACEFLASKGHKGLINLDGGMSTWRGPLERG